MSLGIGTPPLYRLDQRASPVLGQRLRLAVLSLTLSWMLTPGALGIVAIVLAAGALGRQVRQPALTSPDSVRLEPSEFGDWGMRLSTERPSHALPIHHYQPKLCLKNQLPKLSGMSSRGWKV
jgi:hypothetical protein